MTQLITESMIKEAISDAMGGSPVLMFYKGVCMPVSLKENKTVEGFVNFIKKSAKEQIEIALSDGTTSREFKKYCKAVLNIIYDSIIRRGDDLKLDDDEIFDVDLPGFGTTREVTALWYLNVEILLQLKALKNDNQNGWLMISVLGNHITMTK